MILAESIEKSSEDKQNSIEIMEPDTINEPPLITDEPLIEKPIPTDDDKASKEKSVGTTVEKNHDEEPQSDCKDITDSGIFEFMTPDRAIELYKRIHSSGPPELEWKFYGRKNPEESSNENVEEAKKDIEEVPNSDITLNQTANTEFDFDDEFLDLQADNSLVNESLQLKRKFEPGAEKKTNLSDVMSDMMKESHIEDNF